MAVYFANQTTLDLALVRVMGVSVKTGNTPIGYFGTGLKYAISVLVRTGHRVAIFTRNPDTGNETEYRFATREQAFRGKDFRVVTMTNRDTGETIDLPFTTEFGKNWEVWQAYRELHSNTLDEGGVITDDCPHPDDYPYETLIAVTGASIQKAYMDRHTIFIAGAPADVHSTFEVYTRPSKYVYYRGVRAGTLPHPSEFTYNITTEMSLTEDRNLESMYLAQFYIENDIVLTQNADVAEGVVFAGPHSFEAKMTFSHSRPSSVFRRALMQRSNDARAPAGIRDLISKLRHADGDYESFTPTPKQEDILRDAMALIESLAPDLPTLDVRLARTLGEGIYGLYSRRSGKIFIDEATLNMGIDFVASTLYEEYLHAVHKLEDCSRAMQQHLFDVVISMQKELNADRDS